MEVQRSTSPALPFTVNAVGAALRTWLRVCTSPDIICTIASPLVLVAKVLFQSFLSVAIIPAVTVIQFMYILLEVNHSQMCSLCRIRHIEDPFFFYRALADAFAEPAAPLRVQL